MLEKSQYTGLLKAAKNLDVSDSLLRDWFAGQVLGNLGLENPPKRTAALVHLAISSEPPRATSERRVILHGCGSS